MKLMIKKSSTSHFKLFLILAVAFIFAGLYLFQYYNSASPININEIATSACTKDAFTCSDGTLIGRTGPNCEFVCPGKVLLSASPTPSNLTLGQNYKLGINANPGTNQLVAVQLELTYNPTELEIFGLGHSNYLPNFLVNPIFESGKFTTTLAVQPNSGGISYPGSLGTIDIKPLKLGEHTIQFEPNTQVSIIGSDSNALQITDPIKLTVYNQGDINYDKVVNLFDYTFFVIDYGKSGYSAADLNQSGKVDLFDYTIFVNNYGKTSP